MAGYNASRPWSGHTGPVNRRRCILALRALAGAVGLALVAAAPAGATWSVVAVDPETGEVGAALASCVPPSILGRPDTPLVPIVLVPGQGAAVTQGELDLTAPDRIIELVKAGAAPGAIVDDLVRPELDAAAPTRQHAVVSTAGAAAYTGSELSPQALDRQGDDVSAQGNLLVSDEVVTAALAAFEDSQAGGSGLRDALVAGLVAGSGRGGDRRCPDQTALFAQVAVARPGDDPEHPTTLVTVSVDQGDGQNPVTLLADAVADGRSGLIEAGTGRSGLGMVVQIAALVAATAMAVGGVALIRRGLGSTRARR